MTDIVSVQSFPVLEKGNLSFLKASYNPIPKTSNEECSLLLEHRIDNSDFFHRLIEENKATFGCQVSIKKTGYRRLVLFEHSIHDVQMVRWEKKYLAEPPMIRPMLLATQKINHTFKASDGVANVWLGQSVEFPIGARLARGPYLRPASSMTQLLIIRKNEKLNPTSFEISESTNNGFIFYVDLGVDLFTFINVSPGNEDNIIWHNLHIHFISRCLEILRKDFSHINVEGHHSWLEFPNLKMLSEQLDQKDLLHWSHEDFKSDKIATELYLIKIPKQDQEES